MLRSLSQLHLSKFAFSSAQKWRRCCQDIPHMFSFLSPAPAFLEKPADHSLVCKNVSFSGNLAQILVHLVLLRNNDTMEKRSVEWLPTWLSKYFSSSPKVSSFLSICSSVCFNLFISMIKAFLPKLKKESDPEPPVFHFLKQIKIKTNQY